jgi:hypothetical protein
MRTVALSPAVSRTGVFGRGSSHLHHNPRCLWRQGVSVLPDAGLVRSGKLSNVAHHGRPL